VSEKPRTEPARGMRDFLPEDIRRREHVIGIVKRVYERYGFEPLETPAVENIETLLGKYGDEGNQLIYKILMRGEHAASGRADLALRYDLTVPLARVVAHHQGKLPRLFKRYQIQPVWRADRPARGRFREFYQCDVDALGSTSPVVEAEVCAAVAEVLTELGFSDFRIRLNHRQLLTAVLTAAGISPELHGDALVAIDKLDKVVVDGVARELAERGVNETSRQTLAACFLPEGATLAGIEEFVGTDAAGKSALANLHAVLALCQTTPADGHLQFDPSLARGLSYYTGAIMEINVPDLAGSIGAGGRYDNLVGMFLGESIPACGFSLGLERILVVMQERGMFPVDVGAASVDVVVATLDGAGQPATIRVAAELRRAGLRVDVFPDVVSKMDRIFKHVDQRRAGFIAILGSDEVRDGTVSVRNVATRQHLAMPVSEAAPFIQQALRARDRV
jgi:histidyl-tRNA synthetase